jgi:hypothetical protein
VETVESRRNITVRSDSEFVGGVGFDATTEWRDEERKDHRIAASN